MPEASRINATHQGSSSRSRSSPFVARRRTPAGDTTENASGRASARPIASIVVGTSKPEKDWIPERWAEVADTLHEEFGMQVVMVGGRSERELTAERIVMDKAKHKPRSELGSGLRNLVSILDASALVLSPDTGPLHMTVALNRPVISLMGYTNPKRTGPYRRFHDLIIDAYGNPGEVYPISMENRPGRMKRIETRHVLEKVRLWRDRYAGDGGQ